MTTRRCGSAFLCARRLARSSLSALLVGSVTTTITTTTTTLIPTVAFGAPGSAASSSSSSSSSLSSSRASSSPRRRQKHKQKQLSQFHHIRNIVVVGGTHGNEYTGVWCIKSMDVPHRRASLRADFPSLDVSTLLGNPAAHLMNRRFVDVDLNREFSEEKLTKPLQGEEECNEKEDGEVEEECPIPVGEEGLPLTVESLRAREVDAILGPKFDPEKRTDVVIDLHSTTSNMGTTVIIPEGDVLMAQAAAYVLRKCGGEGDAARERGAGNECTRRGGEEEEASAEEGEEEEEEKKKCHGDARVLLHTIPKREQRPNLSSAGRHGFTVEVGPVPQGVLRHDAVESTDRAVRYVLEFLHRRNVEGPDALFAELRRWYPTGGVPCYRSAPATRDGEMSGKISWPTDAHNPNFPSMMVHKSLQDRDFTKIRKGDPLFVTLDGKVVTYDGSHGEEVYLIFVNEGGYYYKSSGTGIGVAVKDQYDLVNGTLMGARKKAAEEEEGRLKAENKDDTVVRGKEGEEEEVVVNKEGAAYE